MKSLKELLRNNENYVRAPDRNPLIAPQADLAKTVKNFLNQYETKKLGKIDSPWNRYGSGHSFGDLLFGESPELLDDMSYGYNPLTAGKTGRLPIPDKRLLDMPVPIPATGGLGVIKNKGGNWLTGSVENALKGLKRGPRTGASIEDLRAELSEVRPGSPSAERIQNEINQLSQHVPINSWIDNTLTKYVKNRMATPDDEVRKLADQGILHYEPRYTGVMKDTRTAAGFPEEGMAQSPLGHLWEDISDDKILSETKGVRSSRTDDFARVYPEFSKVTDDAQIYQPYANRLDNLGWEHLIDELLNSTNPESGLPMNLRMKPEGFKGLTMEEAVKKVHGINQHRALQAEVARKKMSRAEGIPTSKTYDDGFRFVAPEDVTKNPKHREYVKDAGKRGAWCTQGELCDHYAGGDSRVEILIDDFGNPHAQIAIEKEVPNVDDFIDNLINKDRARYESMVEKAKQTDDDLYDGIVPQVLASPEWENYVNDLQLKQKITEIKPLGNSWDHEKVQELMAKDPNYQQKIQEKLQDFVKSRDWSSVSDLDNTGLLPVRQDLQSRFDMKDINISDIINDAPKFGSSDEYDEYVSLIRNSLNLD